MSIKNPLTPAGIEPTTFRFVAQHLNQCATLPRSPQYIANGCFNKLSISLAGLSLRGLLLEFCCVCNIRVLFCCHSACSANLPARHTWLKLVTLHLRLSAFDRVEHLSNQITALRYTWQVIALGLVECGPSAPQLVSRSAETPYCKGSCVIVIQTHRLRKTPFKPERVTN